MEGDSIAGRDGRIHEGDQILQVGNDTGLFIKFETNKNETLSEVCTYIVNSQLKRVLKIYKFTNFGM